MSVLPPVVYLNYFQEKYDMVINILNFIDLIVEFQERQKYSDNKYWI